MRKVIVFFLLICLSFYACEDKKPQGIASEPVPEIINKQILVNYQNCNTDSLSCTYAIITYPHFTDSSKSAINILLDDKILLLASDYMRKDRSNLHLRTLQLPLSMTTKPSKTNFLIMSLGGIFKSVLVIYNMEKLISFRMDISTFTGGAHPNSSTNYYIYDIQSKKELTTKDLISDTTQFKQILEQAFREQSGMEEGQSFADAGFYINEGDFILNDNIGITEDQLIVHFNPYEIAPYSLGPITVELEREKIGEILKIN